MKQYLLSILFLITGTAVMAQAAKGIVTDSETGKPLASVTVINLTTEESTYTDEDGNFTITVEEGDPVAFSHIGYTGVQQRAEGIMHVAMQPINHQLKEFELKGHTTYQKDSTDMRDMYSKPLEEQKIKPKLYTGGGIGVDGLFSSIAQKFNKRYKQEKKFREQFIEDERQKFVDTRYTPKLVSELTGYTGDTLVYFMYAYPMEYEFARTAKDLELKMWIRNNYKEYLDKRRGSGE